MKESGLNRKILFNHSNLLLIGSFFLTFLLCLAIFTNVLQIVKFFIRFLIYWALLAAVGFALLKILKPRQKLARLLIPVSSIFGLMFLLLFADYPTEHIRVLIQIFFVWFPVFMILFIPVWIRT